MNLTTVTGRSDFIQDVRQSVRAITLSRDCVEMLIEAFAHELKAAAHPGYVEVEKESEKHETLIPMTTYFCASCKKQWRQEHRFDPESCVYCQSVHTYAIDDSEKFSLIVDSLQYWFQGSMELKTEAAFSLLNRLNRGEKPMSVPSGGGTKCTTVCARCGCQLRYIDGRWETTYADKCCSGDSRLPHNPIAGEAR